MKTGHHYFSIIPSSVAFFPFVYVPLSSNNQFGAGWLLVSATQRVLYENV